MSLIARQPIGPNEVPYPTPGKILLEELLKPMGITLYRLGKEIGVPQRRIGMTRLSEVTDR